MDSVGASAGGGLADTIAYDGNGQAATATERIFTFRARSEVRPKRVTLRDWNLTQATGVRMVEESAAATLDVSGGISVTAGLFGLGTLSVDAAADLDVDALPIAMKDASITEYQRDAALLGTRDRDRFAEHALSQLRSDRITAQGESDCRRLAPGYRFRLAQHPIDLLNTEYVATGVRSTGYAPDHAPADCPHLYRCSFECVPASIDPRPQKPAPRPSFSPEPARVVGPTYGDIHCDTLGRILVQFRWAETSRSDSASPTDGVCWAHWLERWGGDGYGTQTLPRVGTEVLVEFHAGGEPIATGQIRSRANAPAFSLPREATKLGIRTRTVPNGGGSEISIDDNPFSEKVLVRANGELCTEARGHATTTLHNDYDLTVEKDRRETTHGDATHTFAKDLRHTVGGSVICDVQGDRMEAVAGSVTESIAGAVTRTISGPTTTTQEAQCCATFEDDVLERYLGHRSIVVGTPDERRSFGLHVEGAARCSSRGAELVVREGFVLRCGDTRIHVGPKSVSISSPELRFDVGTLAVAAKDFTATASDSLALNAAQTLSLAGSGGTVTLDDNATLTGQKVKLNSAGSSSQSSSTASTKPPTRIVLNDQNGKPLANARVLVRSGGEGGEQRIVVLDADGAFEVESDDALDAIFPELPNAQIQG
jgi:type VI secretion system secreted protein VgrG